MDLTRCRKFLLEFAKEKEKKGTIRNPFTGKDLKIGGAAAKTWREKCEKYMSNVIKTQCNNETEVFTLENIEDMDPLTIYISSQKQGFEINALAEWVLSRNLDNQDPYGKKIWEDDKEWEEILAHPMLKPELRKQLQSNHHDTHREVIQKNRQSFHRIGEVGLKLFADNTSSHSHDSKQFVQSQKGIHDLNSLIKKKSSLGELVDNQGQKLKDILETAHQSCVHGVGINLFKLYCYNWTDNYQKVFKKKSLPSNFYRWDGFPIIMGVDRVVNTNTYQNPHIIEIAILICNTKNYNRCRFCISNKNIVEENQLFENLLEKMSDNFNDRDEDIIDFLTNKICELKDIASQHFVGKVKNTDA